MRFLKSFPCFLALTGLAAPVGPAPDVLVRAMTREEKIAQLSQAALGVSDPNNRGAGGDGDGAVLGSYLFNQGCASAPVQLALRRRAERTRLRIPPLFGADVIHGYRTIFPIPLAQACAWDPVRMRLACAAAAREAQADGIEWTFAPMVDVAIDPRWGRIAETFGESPEAVSVCAAASVRGYREGGITACLKHYVGYGASEGGRDYTYTDVSRQRLWEMYLPPFVAGLRAGAGTVMSGFNDLNGTPASANAYTLTEVLRRRLGFRGLVVSDWAAVAQLVRQGAAGDERAAARRALLAGVDVDMADGLFLRHLPGLAESGEVPEAAIDRAVERVLWTKTEAGIFGRPLLVPPAPDPAPARALARELAAESMVLLKNEGVLPLAPGTSVALIGPLAGDRTEVLGSWRQSGRPDETVSVAESLRRAGAGLRVEVASGCGLEGDDGAGFASAVAAAGRADVVLLCLGEAARMSGENAPRSALRLPGRQEELALAVAAAGRPVVLLLFSGRPLDLTRLVARMSAVVAAWQPGSETGNALAELVLGRRDFRGRLAVTWPRTVGQVPLYLGMRPRAREEGGYQDLPTTPLFPFGAGLSYATFEYGPLRLSPPAAGTGRRTATVAVTNRARRPGGETVLWFSRQRTGEITRPLRELRHFETAELGPGETRDFRFSFTARSDFAFPDENGNLMPASGAIDLIAGPAMTRFVLPPP